MLSISRQANKDGFSYLSAPFIGLLLAAFLVIQTAGQMDDSSSDIEYEIVMPISSADLSLISPPRTLNWQGEWVRRFSPRVVQNGWKHSRTQSRNGFGSTTHRIVMEKKWSPLEPSIRFL